MAVRRITFINLFRRAGEVETRSAEGEGATNPADVASGQTASWPCGAAIPSAVSRRPLPLCGRGFFVCGRDFLHRRINIGAVVLAEHLDLVGRWWRVDALLGREPSAHDAVQFYR